MNLTLKILTNNLKTVEQLFNQLRPETIGNEIFLKNFIEQLLNMIPLEISLTQSFTITDSSFNQKSTFNEFLWFVFKMENQNENDSYELELLVKNLLCEKIETNIIESQLSVDFFRLGENIERFSFVFEKYFDLENLNKLEAHFKKTEINEIVECIFEQNSQNKITIDSNLLSKILTNCVKTMDAVSWADYDGTISKYFHDHSIAVTEFINTIESKELSSDNLYQIFLEFLDFANFKTETLKNNFIKLKDFQKSILNNYLMANSNLTTKLSLSLLKICMLLIEKEKGIKFSQIEQEIINQQEIIEVQEIINQQEIIKEKEIINQQEIINEEKNIQIEPETKNIEILENKEVENGLLQSKNSIERKLTQNKLPLLMTPPIKSNRSKKSDLDLLACSFNSNNNILHQPFSQKTILNPKFASPELIPKSPIPTNQKVETQNETSNFFVNSQKPLSSKTTLIQSTPNTPQLAPLKLKNSLFSQKIIDHSTNIQTRPISSIPRNIVQKCKETSFEKPNERILKNLNNLFEHYSRLRLSPNPAKLNFEEYSVSVKQLKIRDFLDFCEDFKIRLYECPKNNFKGLQVLFKLLTTPSGLTFPKFINILKHIALKLHDGKTRKLNLLEKQVQVDLEIENEEEVSEINQENNNESNNYDDYFGKKDTSPKKSATSPEVINVFGERKKSVSKNLSRKIPSQLISSEELDCLFFDYMNELLIQDTNFCNRKKKEVIALNMPTLSPIIEPRQNDSITFKPDLSLSRTFKSKKPVTKNKDVFTKLYNEALTSPVFNQNLKLSLTKNTKTKKLAPVNIAGKKPPLSYKFDSYTAKENFKKQAHFLQHINWEIISKMSFTELAHQMQEKLGPDNYSILKKTINETNKTINPKKIINIDGSAPKEHMSFEKQSMFLNYGKKSFS